MTNPSVRILQGLAASVIAAGLLAATVSLEAWRAAGQGEAAEAAGDLRDAVRHYERTLRWYSPWSPSVRRAVERLWAIGEEARRAGDSGLAAEAYGSLRSGCLAAKSFYLPFAGKVAQCEARLGVSISPALNAGGEGVEMDLPKEEVGEESRSGLARPAAPREGPAFLACLGLAGWIGCAVGFIWRSFYGRDGFFWRPALRWGMMAIAFYAAWIVGLARA